MEPDKKTKGKKKIIFGVILIIIAVILTFLPIALLIPEMVSKSQDIAFKAPGSIEISIEEPGCYYLWNNYKAVFEGQKYSVNHELPDKISFSLVKKDTDVIISLASDGSTTTSFGDNAKISIGYYDIVDSGSYTLTVSDIQEERIFSFSKSIFGSPFLVAGGMLVLFLLSSIAGIGALILIISGIINLTRKPNS